MKGLALQRSGDDVFAMQPDVVACRWSDQVRIVGGEEERHPERREKGLGRFAAFVL